MGCADLIPGVSGGTIALITGIYEKLINSVRSIDTKALQLLLKFRINELWNYINGAFIIHVLAGIFVSLITFSSLFSYLLDTYPIPVWSFFFGLTLVSVFYVFPRKRRISTYFFGVFGTVLAFIITSFGSSPSPDQIWFIFISGFIAICAMILPGISGSFILILLSRYEFILNAVNSFDIKVILVFGIGCMVGLVSFSKLIHWLLQKYKSITMASLAGFMLGSLNKVWPWKLSDDEVSFVNLMPQDYTENTGDSNQLLLSIILCLAGVGVVVLLERSGKRAE